MLPKSYFGASNGAHKIVSKDKYLFSEIKYSKTLLTDDKIDMTAALYFEIYSLLLSQLPFSSSFVSLFLFCTFLSCFVQSRLYKGIQISLWGSHFLEKGPPLGSHWPISRMILSCHLLCAFYSPDAGEIADITSFHLIFPKHKFASVHF